MSAVAQLHRGQRRRVTRAIRNLVARALVRSRTFDSCAAASLRSADEGLVVGKIEGWSVTLEASDHGGVSCWHMSAMLWPAGRSSVEADWQILGYLVAEVASATGRGTAERLDPLTPIATTDPSRPHHWAWHSDGSPLDATIVAARLSALRAIGHSV